MSDKEDIPLFKGADRIDNHFMAVKINMIIERLNQLTPQCEKCGKCKEEEDVR
jgi:hypothetical protein